jgi:GMP synthase-like glutamine amidotransferase
MRYHCLQHVAFETPGLIANWIGERGDVLSFTGLFQNDPLPAIHEFDGLVIMGGPMSIHDEGELAWLKKEKELITAALREKKKVLGICLGAQLVAEALGARVYPNSQKEIGFWPLHWTEAARSWLGFSCQPGGEEEPGSEGRADAAGGWPTESLVFHWHGETFDLPEGSIHLVLRLPARIRAFSWGRPHWVCSFIPS